MKDITKLTLTETLKALENKEFTEEILVDHEKRVDWIHAAITSGLLEPPFELADTFYCGINKIKKEDIKNIANKYLTRGYTITGVINPQTRNTALRDYIKQVY